MWAAIRTAKENVWMETFLLNPDPVGLKMIYELTQAAKRGCNVVVIYDKFGSLSVREKHVSKLIQAGAAVLPYNSFNKIRLQNLAKWPIQRNHRKLLIIDDTMAFCGGMNMHGDHAGRDVGGNARFRDTHAKVTGPAVNDLAKVFIHSLQVTDPDGWKGKIKINEKHQHIRPIKNGVFVQVLESDAKRNKRNIQKALLISLRNATSHCYLTSPYFLPPLKLRREIMNAAARGVDVRLLTQGLCRTPIISQASQHIYGLFLRNGVKVYQMFDKELHAKTATIDGVYASIGTYNFDNLSFKHMLEVNFTVIDPKTALELEDHFKNDLAYSEELNIEIWEKRSYWKRFIHGCAYFMSQIFLR
eukprot:TRINITY_DN6096_c0_g1_i1.p1 TRINITY_DN6096_c0_g1~~TRINITY_DN6096_c0_g1_i1.p1  ORF type:complete len:359 (-),score=61.30 TRINITY_DN6096_c0_g1_i1:40-1116(-)